MNKHAAAREGPPSHGINRVLRRSHARSTPVNPADSGAIDRRSSQIRGRLMQISDRVSLLTQNQLTSLIAWGLSPGHRDAPQREALCDE